MASTYIAALLIEAIILAPASLAAPAPLSTAAPTVARASADPTAGSVAAHGARPDVDRDKIRVLYNVMTGKCADIPNFNRGRVGGPVTQYFCRPGDDDNQRIVVNYLPAPPGAPAGPGREYVTLQTLKDGLCLDAPGRIPAAPGTRIKQAKCRPGGRPARASQIFRIEFPPLTGSLSIVNHPANLCLGVDGYRSTRPDIALRMEVCNRNDDQFWLIPHANAAMTWAGGSNWADILRYMTAEMRTNGQKIADIRRDKGRNWARAYFTGRVAPGRIWDHKKPIRERFFGNKGPFYTPVPGQDHFLFYDVWSNIHYGYVGTIAGWSEQDLIDGSHLGAAGKTDADDDISVRLGVTMAKRMTPHDLSTVTLGLSIRDTIPNWDREPDGEATRPIPW